MYPAPASVTLLSDGAALTLLAEEFPDVPDRILAAVWGAYRRICDSRASAVAATRARLADACALTATA